MAVSNYEIRIMDFSFSVPTTGGIRKEMDALREGLADLIGDIDQTKMSWIVDHNAYGDDGMDHQSIFVPLNSVGEAVRRINEAGYATDEDESEEDEDEEDYTLYDGMDLE